MAALLHHLGDVFVVQPQRLLVAVVHELVIKSELDNLTFDKLHLFSAALKVNLRYLRYFMVNLNMSKVSIKSKLRC